MEFEKVLGASLQAPRNFIMRVTPANSVSAEITGPEHACAHQRMVFWRNKPFSSASSVTLRLALNL
jgi:hypothetical protein